MKKLLFTLSSMISLSFANDCSSINSKAQEIMSKNQINGIAIAIINKDKVEFCNYGYAYKNKKYQITNKSIFEIASLTKTFTAQLAGIAVSDNKLSLDTPITKYIPELSANERYKEINNQELLTHVAGLPFKYGNEFTESELLVSAIKNKPMHSPGTYYQYSNLGITLAAISLTRIYNTTYENLLNKFILGSIGMKYTSMNVSAKNKKLLVPGYDLDNNPVGLMNLGVMNPAGGLKSNTYDLSKYLRFQMASNNSKSDKKVLDIIHKKYYCLNQDGKYQELVWEYHPIDALSQTFNPGKDLKSTMLAEKKLPKNCKNTDDGFIDKTGNSSGASSYIGYIPNKEVGVVILANKALQPDVINLGRYILKSFTN